MSNFVLIERADVERDYGFRGTEAILEHPTHGRVLLKDGYGGEGDLVGGAVRWRHGMAIKLRQEDTFESLASDVEARLAIYAGWDESRPILDWDGVVIDRVARDLGL